MANKVRGLTVEINGDVTKLRTAMKSISKDAKSLRSELKQVEKLAALDPTNTTLIAQRQTLYSKSIRETANELNRLRAMRAQVVSQDDGSAEAARQIREYDRAIANAEMQLSLLSRRAIEFGASASTGALRAIAEYRATGTEIESVGKALTKVSLAAAAALGASVYAAMQYESSFAGVRKTIMATEEEYRRLAETTREFALEKPINVNDVNQIMEWAGQLGIATENLSKFTDTVADLTVSTDLDLEDASMKLAQFINITGVGFAGGVKEAQASVDRLGSVIADLGNNTATTETRIVNMAMRVAGTGTQIGLTQQEILGLSATLAAVGIEAEMGGNAISTILNKVDKDIDMNSERLGTWADVAGMSVDEFVDKWKNTDTVMEAIQAIVTGLGTYKDEAGNLNTLLTELGVNYMRQIDTAKRLTNAGTQLHDNVALANEAWESNSALTREAEQRYQTLESRITLLKNAAYDMAITFGNDMMPGVRDFVDGAAEFIRTIGEMDDGQRKALETALGFTAVMAPLLIITGKTGIGFATLAEKAAQLKTGIALLRTGTVEGTGALTHLETRTMQLIATDGRLITVTKELEIVNKTGAVAVDQLAARQQRLAAETAMATARTALASKAMAALKMVGFDLAIVGAMMLIKHFIDLKKRTDTLVKATSGLEHAAASSAGAIKGSAASAAEYSKLLGNASKSTEELAEKNAELADEINDKMLSMKVDAALVVDYRNKIIDLMGKTGDSAIAQRQLKDAVEAYNSITGESIEITDEVNGILNVSAQKLKEDSDAWIENAKAQAVQQQVIELMRTRMETALSLQAKLEELRALQQEAATATDQYEQDLIMIKMGKVTKEIRDQYALLDSNTNSINTLNRMVGDTSGDLLTLSSDLGIARKDIDLLNSVLNDSTPEAITNMVTQVNKGGDEVKSKVVDTKAEIENELKTLAANSYSWGYDFGQNYYTGISQWTPLISNEISNALAEKSKFSVPKKGPWSGAEKGGETSGRHFVENFARGMERGMDSIDRQIAVMGSMRPLQTAEAQSSAAQTFNLYLNGAQVNGDAAIESKFYDFMMDLQHRYGTEVGSLG